MDKILTINGRVVVFSAKPNDLTQAEQSAIRREDRREIRFLTTRTINRMAPHRERKGVLA